MDNNRQPYIAYPQKIQSADDIKELTVIRNRYADETGTGKYIAFSSYFDIGNYLGLSCSQFKHCINNEERMKKVAIGDSIEECVDRLIDKLNV